MKCYRMYHRTLRKFQDVRANSAQEACETVGWMIGDCWVREETRGKFANGWRNITRRVKA